MYLIINVAHEHLIIQTDKKSKPALINFMGPGAEGPRAEKNKYPENLPIYLCSSKNNTLNISHS